MVELNYLWVQEFVQDERISINEINGLDNPADCLTKAKHLNCFEPFAQSLGSKVEVSDYPKGRVAEGGVGSRSRYHAHRNKFERFRPFL